MIRAKICVFSLLFTHFFLSGAVNVRLSEKTVSQTPPDFISSRFDSIVEDDQGNVFVLSVRECKILKFDAALRLKTAFGREGKGPGDFQTVYRIANDRISVNSKGEVHLLDYAPARLAVFSNDGQHLRDVMLHTWDDRLFRNVDYLKVINDRFFICIVQTGKGQKEAIVFSTGPFRVRFRYLVKQFFLEINAGNYYSSGRRTRFYGDNFFFAVGEGRVVVADSQQFEIRIFNAATDRLSVILDDGRKMTGFSGPELEKLAEGFKEEGIRASAIVSKLLDALQGKKNVIEDVFLAGDKIVVFPVRENVFADEYPAMIYRDDGRYLKTVVFGAPPVYMRKNHVYYYARDNNDNPSIIRYVIAL